MIRNRSTQDPIMAPAGAAGADLSGGPTKSLGDRGSDARSFWSLCALTQMTVLALFGLWTSCPIASTSDTRRDCSAPAPHVYRLARVGTATKR